jgi:uncharacterized protein
MVKKEDLEIINDFADKLSKIMPIEKVILFGSRAKEKTHEWSDFDIMVVSTVFNGVASFKRGAEMHNYWNYGYPVDFLCYTPEEFNKLKKKISLVKEILSSGVIVR